MKFNRKATTLVHSLFFSACLATTTAFAADVVASVSMSDADITKGVEKALSAEPTLKNRNITVSTATNEKGEKEVTLKGIVPDQQMIVTAGLAAEHTQGVKYVINFICPADYAHDHASECK